MQSIRKDYLFLASSSLLFGFMAVMKELLPSASVTIIGRFLFSSFILLLFIVIRSLFFTKQSIIDLTVQTSNYGKSSATTER